MSRLTRSQLAFLVGLFIVMMILVACATSKPTETPVPPTRTPTITLTPTPLLEQSVRTGPISPDTQAMLRFVLAAPDSPRLDIYVGTAFAVSQLEYGSLSPAMPKAAGKYLVRALPAGSTLNSQNPLVQGYIDFTPRQSVIVVLSGTADKLALNQITQNTDPVDPGMARIQVVHALQSDGTPIDVSADNRPTGSLASAGQLLDLGAQKADMHAFQFTHGQRPVLSQSAPMVAAKVYTLILCGSASNASLVIASSSTETSSRLRVLNMTALLGPVDVYIGDKLLAQAVDSHKSTDWISVPAYATAVRVLNAGMDASAPPLYKGDITLRGDQGGDLVVYDQSQSTRARIFWEDLHPTVARTARLSVLNMVNGVPAVQMDLDKQPFKGLPPVPYNSMSISAILPVGEKQIAFNTYGELTARLIEEVNNPVMLNEGTAYVYVVTGAGTTTAPLLLSTTVGVDKASIIPTPTPTSLPSNTMQVRFINASLNNKPVDIHLGDRVVFSGLKRGQISGPLLVPQTDDAYWVSGVGLTTRMAFVKVPFQPGKVATLIVVGGEGPLLRIATSLADIPAWSDKGMVQVIHTGQGPPAQYFEAVAVTNVSSTGLRPTATSAAIPNSIKLTDQIDWGTVVDSPLPPGKYVFFTRQTPDALPALLTEPFTIEAGKHYELVLVADKGKPRLFFLPLDVL